MNELFQGEALAFDPLQIVSHLLKLAVAFLLALPLGWDRERSEKRAGLRTFPLVATAACGFILVSETLFEADADARSRVIQGLITGVGFLGGGAIVKRGVDVKGTATAASLWITAALGAAVAYGRVDIALCLSVVTFATLHWMSPLKQLAKDDGDEAVQSEAEEKERRWG